MKELHLTTNQKNQMIDITNKIQQYIREEKIIDGYLIVYVPHTTAAVTINEGADPSVQKDIMDTLEKLVPENPAYHHPEGNSDAHIKASLLGSSVTVLISKGSLVLGTWQHIFFYEADGPRHRTVYLYINKDR
jgi:secondary thiamine-phosphate synthase enzyme